MKHIGEHYANKDNFKYYGEYCLLKEKGLKKSANKEITNFIAHLKKISLEEQREISLELAFLNLQYSGVCYQILSHFLGIYIVETLKNWINEDPNNVDVLCATGHLCRDYELYKKILTIDPNHQISLNYLINDELDSVDCQTHHLDEGHFIGELESAEASLTSAKERLQYIEKESQRIYLQKEYQYYRDLVETWKKFLSEKTEQDFLTWCEKQGKEFSFPQKVYYS